MTMANYNLPPGVTDDSINAPWNDNLTSELIKCAECGNWYLIEDMVETKEGTLICWDCVLNEVDFCRQTGDDPSDRYYKLPTQAKRWDGL